MPGGVAGWFVPIGKSLPYEAAAGRRFNGDDGIVFRLDGLGRARLEIAKLVETGRFDNDGRRGAAVCAGAAQERRACCGGDELASTTFWHGALLSARGAALGGVPERGARASYAMTAMEDGGDPAGAYVSGEGRGEVDFSRVVIVRAGRRTTISSGRGSRLRGRWWRAGLRATRALPAGA